MDSDGLLRRCVDNACSDPVSHLEAAFANGFDKVKVASVLSVKQKQLMKGFARDPIGNYNRVQQELDKWKGRKKELTSTNQEVLFSYGSGGAGFCSSTVS